MRAYLRNYGWHFNARACEYAVSLMKKKNPTSGKDEPVEMKSKEQVLEMLKKYNVTIEDTSNYDFVFVWHMGTADYLKSSIPDEAHLALYVKDVIGDVDAADGVTMRRWYATMVANGDMVDWSEIL